MLRDMGRPERGPEGEIFMNGASGPDYEHNNDNGIRVDPLDDVFGSAPASPTLGGNDGSAADITESRPSALDPSDIPRLRSTHVTNGYREGIAASKEKYMQEGFDEGYTLGAELGMRAGWCLGALEGIWHALPASTSDSQDESEASQSDSPSRSRLAALRSAAQTELDVNQLCGREYFGEDGTWLYHVPDSGADHEPTFEQVVTAHPIIRKWMQELDEVSGMGVFETFNKPMYTWRGARVKMKSSTKH